MLLSVFFQNSALVYSDRGNALEKLHKLDEAIADYNRAIALAPPDSGATAPDARNDPALGVALPHQTRRGAPFAQTPRDEVLAGGAYPHQIDLRLCYSTCRCQNRRARIAARDSVRQRLQQSGCVLPSHGAERYATPAPCRLQFLGPC